MSDEIDLEIPDFLKRKKGEKLPPWKPSPAAPHVVAEEKWRAMERERAEARKLKARGRVAKMLSVRADREAVAAGKVWDVHKGGVAMSELNAYEVARLEAEVERLREECNDLTIRVSHLIGLIEEIEELADGEEDITARGGPNLAMRIKTLMSRK